MTREELKKAMSLSDDIDKFETKLAYLNKLKDEAKSGCTSLGLNLSFVNVPATFSSTCFGTDRELMREIIDLAISHFEKKREECVSEFQKL